VNQPALIQPGDWDAGTQLPCRSRTITQEQLNRYSRVSGDQNPLHLDPDFAAATQFGGIIAHGMLTLALISEMLVAAFGNSWLESGGLKVRFKGAAYVGENLETWGRVEKIATNGEVTELVCAVGVWHRDRDPDRDPDRVPGLDREIITGTATLTLS
jgi:3-hydroxybutyryl-CoA dehydratase